MAFGLPISVAIGWTLATPVRRPVPIGAADGSGGLGAGGLGAAPERATARPVTTVDYSARPARPGLSPAPSAVVTPAASGPPITATPSPSATGTVATLPPLTLPPVPTPTEITTTPTGPADPSTSAPATGTPPAP